MANRRSQLLDILYSGRPATAVLKQADKHRNRGLASNLPYPFLAIVGQMETASDFFKDQQKENDRIEAIIHQ